MNTASKNAGDRIGPDLDIAPGLVAMIDATGHAEDGRGHVFKVAGGGTLIVRFLPGASTAATRARAAGTEVSEHTREAVKGVLRAWAADPEGRPREWHADRLGVPRELISALCEERPGKPSPPMRAEIENARLVRARTKNATYRRPPRKPAGFCM